MTEEMPIQQEIADLERRLQEKREQLLSQHTTGEIAEVPHEKETLHQVVGEKLTESTLPSGLPSAGQSLQSPTPSTPSITMPTALTEEMKAQVQELVGTAFTRGIDRAIREVRATNNAALIDAFHDLLVDELYNYLVERGKLKQF